MSTPSRYSPPAPVGRNDGLIVDAFAGPGGWDTGLQYLDHDRPVIGFEWDKAACKVRAAAGHRTIRQDVSTLSLEHLRGTVDGLIASPPCQDFSRAGKRAGEQGERGRFVREPLRLALECSPRWVALEQVSDALPIWRELARDLEVAGYSTWAGLLSSERYGVPQTRERAILIARRDDVAAPPEPTHQEYRPGEPAEWQHDLFGDSLRPWVSMAQALEWDRTDRSYHRHRAPAFGERRNHPSHEPAPTLTQKARSDTWVLRTGNNSMVTGRTGSRAGEGDVFPYERSTGSPAPTVDTGAGSKWTLWPHGRPSTTVVGDPRIGRPGHKGYQAGGESQFAQGSVRVTTVEAGVLQSFPADYPWLTAGSKTAAFGCIGNAIPPLMAAAILAPLVGADFAALWPEQEAA